MEHYDTLFKLNPKLKKIKRLVSENYPSDPEEENILKSIDPENYSYYTSLASMIFVCKTKKYITFSEDNPSSIDHYQIVFSVGKSVNNTKYIPVQYCYSCRTEKGRTGCMFCQYDYSNCKFYNKLFLCNPLNPPTCECNGNKCRYNIKDDGIWCISCNGDIENASYLEDLMVEELKFLDLPKKAIVQIWKKSKKITEENRQELSLDIQTILNNEIELVKKFEMEIGEKNLEIQKTIERILVQKNKLESELKEHLELFGGSVEDLTRRLNHLNDSNN